MSKPIYCGLAFGSVSMGNQGQLRPCCGIVPSKFDHTYENSTHINDRLNASNLREVRKFLMAGIWHPACGLCKNTEDIGSDSMRVIWNRSIPYAPMTDIVDPSSIKYLDLSVSNKCNSKCMTCNPYCSDFWTDEYKIVTEKFIPISNVLSLDSTISETTIRQVLDTYKNVEFINLLGGEPMMSDEHVLLLNELVFSGLSKNISVGYVSNLTVYDEKLVGIWKNFKSVGASLSMDGIGLVNDYLRYPAKFDKIESNLKRYLDLTSRGEFEVTLSCTISIFNFSRYADLLDHYVTLIQQYQGNFPTERMAIYLNYVNTPAYFSSSLLSAEFRAKCMDKLNEVRSRIEKLNLHPSLVESCNTMMGWARESHTYDIVMVDNAIEFIEQSDRYRNRNIKDFIPEVWEELQKMKENYGK